MLESLRSGQDIHANNAQLVWGTRDDVHREWSKTIGFGLIYGMTTGSLQFRLNMTREEAFHVTDQYWGAFPRVKPWLRETIQQVRKQGYVRYWSGRIWREDIEMFFYKGANALIQGGCADLLSIAALRCDAYLKQHHLGHIVNLVHDEILFELLLNSETTEHLVNLGHIMEVPDLLDLPFFTDIKTGPDFGSLSKLELPQ
jgi:DNA polymerase-1